MVILSRYHNYYNAYICYYTVRDLLRVESVGVARLHENIEKLLRTVA